MPGLLDRDKKKAQCLSQHAHNGQGRSVGRGLGHTVLNNTPGFNSDPDPTHLNPFAVVGQQRLQNLVEGPF